MFSIHNYFMAVQGAHIGENVVIDTLDVTDFDLVSIGDNVAIGEGATVMGHYYKDGFLHFDEVMHASQSHVILHAQWESMWQPSQQPCLQTHLAPGRNSV